MRHMFQLSLLLLVTPLVAGWGWFDKYKSRLEAEAACTAWRDAGPTKEVKTSEFRERLRNKWYEYPKIPPEPGAWSRWFDTNSVLVVPGNTPGVEVQKRSGSFAVKVRSCIPELDTKQLLGMENRQIKKRFRY